jgi:hypothetical protein
MDQSSNSRFIAELQKDSSIAELAVAVRLFEKGTSAQFEGTVIAVGEKTLSLRLNHLLRAGQRIGLRINITDRLFDALGIGAGVDADAVVIKSMGEVIKKEDGDNHSMENCYTIRLIGPFSIDQE